jgi:hypothetical protein
MNIRFLAAAASLAVSISMSAPAFAQSDPSSFAQAHVANIASGNAAALAADYRPDAFLWWVGGPLDGTYGGSSAISAVWTKFAAAQGTLKADITGMSIAANPNGQTVVADVVYSGPKASITVRQVMLVRGGHLQDEIWQISPKGVTSR